MTLDDIIDILENQLFILVDDPEHDLLASGDLDSLSFVELLLAVETATGQKLPVSELNLDDLRTPRLITKAFGALLAADTPSRHG